MRWLTGALLLAGAGSGVTARANVVSACSGVSLPKSVLTQTIGDVITPVLAPVESTLSILTFGSVDLGINAALSNAASGAPINLNVLDINGNAVDLLSDPSCETTSDSFSLLTPRGISFGGNKITGLGTPGLEASAGELDAIAIGNLASTATGAYEAVAIGAGASATHMRSVALGAGSVANGLSLNLPAYLVGGTASAEVNIGGRRLTGLAAGANPTDGVNVAQLQAVNDALGTLAGNAVQYDGSARSMVTLQGATGTGITNLSAGAVNATSTDAVNGSQLQATNDLVAQNSAAIVQLGYDLAILNDLAVKYQDGTKSSIILGGAGGTAITNLAAGTTSSDAVNLSQLSSSGSGGGGGGGGAAQDALPYDPAIQAYNAARGGVDQKIGGVAAGELSAASAEAVNGAQLYATNVQLAYNVTAIADLQEARAGYLQVNNSSGHAKPVASGADTLAAGAGAVASGSGSLALGTQAQAIAPGSVALGYASVADRANTVSVGSAGAERQITHVADGMAPTDAVNLRQLQGGMGQAVDAANAYTDVRFNLFDSGLRNLRRDAEGGIAASMAMAGIPQFSEAGGGTLGLGVSTWQGEHAVAMGISKVSDNGRFIMRASATYNSRNQGGANAGMGIAF
ncbi:MULTISPECIES: YadA-like family protein [Sphingobium]|jgi:X-X-X-Leu-X-X-Gly heptad repeat protein|uniref:YadA-like family protein n=2 Tax=Sphingobium fuliginis (strain ATCC 27551) TaxID=336203 RepID=A0A7M2GII5_SPHSA|nr:MULTISPECIES: YadA-like family protein [Sphingobium]QOT71789.1 YadA-like family protein [Sphingobium fuliginis]